MDGIFCNHCGARLDESATLLPDQRPSCSTCGSQSRMFELTIGQAVETDTALPITPDEQDHRLPHHHPRADRHGDHHGA